VDIQQRSWIRALQRQLGLPGMALKAYLADRTSIVIEDGDPKPEVI
jgi:hypothetical protein